MSLLAIIPAKAYSRRLAHKNFLCCNGVSLLERAIKCAKEAEIFNEIVVSTDDQVGAAMADRCQVDLHWRKPILSEQGVESAVVVFDALAFYEYEYDAFCLLNPTTPTRTPVELICAYERLSENDFVVSYTTAFQHDGAFLFGKTLPFLRRMTLIPEDALWVKFFDHVDINILEDFGRAEANLIEREGDCRTPSS